MDGKSWKDDVVNRNKDWSVDRCLYMEMDLGRSIRCGCHKYMQIYNASDTASGTVNKADTLGYTLAHDNYFNLCDDSGEYITSPGINPEQDGNVTAENQAFVTELKEIVECYKNYTDPGENPDYNVLCDDGLATTAAPTTPEPTMAPTTSQPTTAPVTPEPTKFPTESPTVSPTTSPTQSPTQFCEGCSSKNTADGYRMHLIDNGVCTQRCFDKSNRNIKEAQGWECGECPTS